MLRGGAEHQVQRVLDRAGSNWNKNFLISAEDGRQSIRQSASEGVQSDLMGAKDWGRRCMLQLQEAENWNKPAATTWAAEFLLREGESRECLGSWIDSSVVHEAKKRRAKQVITCSTGYHMLIPMRKMVNDWREEEPRMRALQKRKAERQGVG